MDFSDLILKLRYRVQDIRKTDKTIITDATDNGIRWLSSELETITQGAIAELMRTFDALGIKKYVNTAILYRKGSATIGTDGIITGLPSNMISIESLQQTADLVNIYKEITPEEYHNYKYKKGTSESGISLDGFYYTMMLNSTTNAIEVYCLPAGVPTTIEYTCKVSIMDICTISSVIELPFIDLDDLIIDYAERELRDAEYNIEKVKIIDARINKKLSELGYAVQRNN